MKLKNYSLLANKALSPLTGCQKNIFRNLWLVDHRQNTVASVPFSGIIYVHCAYLRPQPTRRTSWKLVANPGWQPGFPTSFKLVAN